MRTITAALLAFTLGSWMTTPKPRPGDWMKKHEHFVQIAHQGGVDVLFVGDSITEGWGDVGHATWKKDFEPLHAANFGIRSDGTQHVLWRLLNGELEGIHPKAVVLLIGTNNIPDTFQGTSPAAEAALVVEAIQLLVKTIHDKLPDTKVLLLGVFPRGAHPNAGRDCIALVNAKLARMDGGFVRYLDLGYLWLHGDEIPRELMSDYLHPTAKGYALWAPALLPELKALLQ